MGGAPGTAVGDSAPDEDAVPPRTTNGGAGGPTESSLWVAEAATAAVAATEVTTLAWPVLASPAGKRSGKALFLVRRGGKRGPWRVYSCTSLITDHFTHFTHYHYYTCASLNPPHLPQSIPLSIPVTTRKTSH